MDRNIESLMRKTYINADKGDINYKAITLSFEFWESFDFVFNANMSKIFKLIYMSDCGCLSILSQSIQCSVSERTLFRYRNFFIKIFQFYINNLTYVLNSDKPISK